MAVFMPQTCGCEDQIAFVHGAFFALHGRETTFTFHHKAHSTGRMAMVGRHFAGQNQLHAYVNGGRGHQLFNAVAWIAEDQDPALGFFNGRQLTSAHQLGTHILVMPNKRLRGAGRFAPRQQAPQLRPQRCNRQSRHVGNVVCW